MATRPGRGLEYALVRRERRVGNWGRASEHIGARWEELGLARLRPLLAGERPWPTRGYRPVGWLSLAADAELQVVLGRVGLPSPDIIVGLVGDGGLVALQAVDMKWHLEFASYKQISAEALRELASRRVPGLHEQLEGRFGPLEQVKHYLDGLFFAPDIPANRAFLASVENRQQEYPLEPGDVIFEPVDGREFFSPLPGWRMALLLADFDRAQHQLARTEGAERYYRLGAGLQGATAQLLSSIFVEEPTPVEAEAAFAWLRKNFRAASAGLLAQAVDLRMAERARMLARLRELLRSPYRLADLSQTLHRRGLSMPQSIEEDSPHAAKCRELLKRVALAHRDAVRRYGLQLVGKGASDHDALATLARELPRFRTLALATADRLAADIFAADR